MLPSVSEKILLVPFPILLHLVIHCSQKTSYLFFISWSWHFSYLIYRFFPWAYFSSFDSMSQEIYHSISYATLLWFQSEVRLSHPLEEISQHFHMLVPTFSLR